MELEMAKPVLNQLDRVNRALSSLIDLHKRDGHTHSQRSAGGESGQVEQIQGGDKHAED
jgi:hypothetical protein